MFGIIGLAWAYGLDIFGRHATPNLASRNLGVLQYQGTCSHDGTFAYLATVEQGRTHTNQGIVVDGAGMHGDVMPDGDLVADMRGTSLVGYVYTTAILNVGTVTDGDRSHIAANHRIKPYRTLITHRHVTHDGSVLAKITVSPPFGSETAI